MSKYVKVGDDASSDSLEAQLRAAAAEQRAGAELARRPSSVRIRVGSEVVCLDGPEESFPADLVEREIAQSRARQSAGSVTLTQVAGKFVERRPRRTVDAVLWTGSNWDVVEAWLRGRVESCKLDPDDASRVVVWDDDARLGCRAGNWFLQDASGEVRVLSADQFAKLYAPTTTEPGDLAAGELEALAEHATSELAKWRQWAALLLRESGPTVDSNLRDKITAVVEAPSAMPREVVPAPRALIEACARVAHEVYRAGLGDPAMLDWDSTQEREREAAREAVASVLLGATPAEWHATWCAKMAEDGWSWGPVKDEAGKRHPNLVTPYEALPPAQRILDQLFVAAVTATAVVVDEIEDAMSVPTLQIMGKAPTSDQLAAFMREWSAQLAQLSSVGWKTPIVDGEVQFIGSGPSRAHQARVIALFEKHCECRPVNTARPSHSHDCDTTVTDDVRTVLHHVVATTAEDEHRDDLRPATRDEVRTARQRLVACLVMDEARPGRPAQ